MSQIAALLLMYMNEEDAFWALSQLLTNQKHGMHGETERCSENTTHVEVRFLAGRWSCRQAACPEIWIRIKRDLKVPPSSLLLLLLLGFFVPGFPKLQRFQAHHDQIISKLIPKLKKHLVRSLLHKSRD